MKRLHPSLVAAVLLAFALARSGAAQAPRFGDSETVVAVEIPVQVLIDGEPVRGLTRDSFEVLEGRKRHAIVDFEVVDLAVVTTPSGRPAALDAAISPAGRRHFLLLFDLTNSEPQAITRARDAAFDLVANDLHPADLVAVATWSYSRGPRLLIGFTADRRQLDAAISSLGVADIRNPSPDSLGLMLTAFEDSSQVGGGGGTGGGGGARGDLVGARNAVVLENLRESAANERAALRQTRGAEVAGLTQGFSQLANLMAGVDGRKYVVLLSQGFDSSLVTGAVDAAREEETAAAVATGEIWRVDSEERFGSTRTANQLEQMLTTFRRADCAIQAIDISGLTTANELGLVRASGRETLLTMARDTGGNFIENFTDLGDAMEKVLQSTSVTYVLTIQPQSLKLDGKFHDLKVRLTQDVSKARLVHRPGFYAPRPFAQQGGTERQLDTAQLLVSGRPGGSLEGGTVATAFRGEGDRMHVPVVLALDGATLLAARSGDALPVAIYIYAFDDKGAVQDFVSQTIRLEVAMMSARLAREPLKFVGDLRLRPGRYAVRALARAGDGGAYRLDQVVVDVPTFESGELFAGAPLFPEPMTTGVVVRASSSPEKTRGLAFPFYLGTEAYLPDGDPQLERGRELRACLNVYGLAGGAAEVRAELVGFDGKVVPDAVVRTVGRTASDQPGLERFELAVQPGSAPAGPYTVRISVEQAGKTVVSAAAVRVVG